MDPALNYQTTEKVALDNLKNKRMKKIRLLIFGLIPIITLGAFSYLYQQEDKKDDVITDLVTASLDFAHYSKISIDDTFSAKVFDTYINYLDYTKKFFLQSDIDELEKYKFQIDDEIHSKSFAFYKKAVEIRNERIIEVEKIYKSILEKPFDFDVDEEIQLDDKKNTFSKNSKELAESWQKALKYQTLLEIDAQLSIQEKAIENKDTLVKQKTFTQIEKEAREKILKRQDDWFKRMRQTNHTDNLSLFLNCITNVYDPHSSYYPPKDKEDFDISISGQLEGIGATLQSTDGYVKVVKIVPGSPSYLQGELKEGDLIIKVAQGSGEPVDVVDMRIDDAVQLIRGKKGTTVKLTVKKLDGSLKVIPIVRDVVIIEETYAKSMIVTSASGKKYGYIYLPQFYVDFENSNGRRCSIDVLQEIEKLKKEKIKGLIIDLRNNGGGSLQDVVTMAGYFIKSGPIVQVKQKSLPIQPLNDYDESVQYDGPMVVLVNSNSASASEIFAAALQDYKRAIIIGSEQTFGKGTVQRFIDLDQIITPQLAEMKPLGSVKITFQKFYRINGGATQLKGVAPNIVLPDYLSEIEYGEVELENHLAWDEIEPAKYETTPYLNNIDLVRSKSLARVEKDADFLLIKEQAKYIKENKDKTIQTLNLVKYRAKQKDLLAANKKFEKIMSDSNAVQVRSLLVDKELIKNDTVKQAINRDFQLRLRKDIYVREALNVLEDSKLK